MLSQNNMLLSSCLNTLGPYTMCCINRYVLFCFFLIHKKKKIVLQRLDCTLVHSQQTSSLSGKRVLSAFEIKKNLCALICLAYMQMLQQSKLDSRPFALVSTSIFFRPGVPFGLSGISLLLMQSHSKIIASVYKYLAAGKGFTAFHSGAHSAHHVFLISTGQPCKGKQIHFKIKNEKGLKNIIL